LQKVKWKFRKSIFSSPLPMFPQTLTFQSFPSKAMLAAGAGFAATVLRDIGRNDEFWHLFRRLIGADKKSVSAQASLATMGAKWSVKSAHLQFRGDLSVQQDIRVLCETGLLRLMQAQQVLAGKGPGEGVRLDEKSRRQLFTRIFESILLLTQAWALALSKPLVETRNFWLGQIDSLISKAWRHHRDTQSRESFEDVHADFSDRRTPMEWLEIIEPAIFRAEKPVVERGQKGSGIRHARTIQRFARSLDLSTAVDNINSNLWDLDEIIGPPPLADALRVRFAGHIFGIEHQFLLGVAVLGCLFFSTLSTVVHPGFTFAIPAVAFLAASLVHWASPTRAD
jgi:hypothetical protein